MTEKVQPITKGVREEVCSQSFDGTIVEVRIRRKEDAFDAQTAAELQRKLERDAARGGPTRVTTEWPDSATITITRPMEQERVLTLTSHEFRLVWSMFLRLRKDNAFGVEIANGYPPMLGGLP